MSNTTHSTNNTTTTISVANTSTSNNSYNKTDAKHRIGNNNNNSNGSTPACAACKYQRRKCAPDCVLAPYFPHDRQRQFLNAHKLFGVRKITKIIENLSTPAEKDEAMRAIIIQSDVRASDPVGGCYRIIRELQRQIEYGEAELALVLHQLHICRQQQQQQQEHQQQQDPQQQQQQSTMESNIDSAMMAVGCLDVYSDPMLLQFHCGQQQAQQQSDQHEEQDQQQLQQHQHHHHHHHHHHHENHELLHQHHHGYVIQEALQDGGSVNSWGMAVGG
ncbi:unnamed protein product [Linum trigynum]|uniref:LOB domain-containing protein n=1 Tax=Linum trigynum TaxID=586398 RepID=A0AAV2FMZ8_9ROSI